jgi:YfiR/HmsC-like
LLPHRAPAQTNNSSEYAVKAAFLFHFAQFVEWPDGTFKAASSPLMYCTLGADPFSGALDDTLRGKTIGERVIHVQHLRSSEPVQGCQVLFIGAVEAKRTSSLLANLKKEPVLTVGESQNFAEEGGMIEFLLEGNKIRFAINLQAVNTARLKMSARLLALAKNVIETGGGN